MTKEKLNEMVSKMIRSQKAIEEKGKEIQNATENNNWEKVRNKLVKYEDALKFTLSISGKLVDEIERVEGRGTREKEEDNEKRTW